MSSASIIKDMLGACEPMEIFGNGAEYYLIKEQNTNSFHKLSAAFEVNGYLLYAQ